MGSEGLEENSGGSCVWGCERYHDHHWLLFMTMPLQPSPCYPCTTMPLHPSLCYPCTTVPRHCRRGSASASVSSLSRATMLRMWVTSCRSLSWSTSSLTSVRAWPRSKERNKPHSHAFALCGFDPTFQRVCASIGLDVACFGSVGSIGDALGPVFRSYA